MSKQLLINLKSPFLKPASNVANHYEAPPNHPAKVDFATYDGPQLPSIKFHLVNSLLNPQENGEKLGSHNLPLP